MTEKTIRELFVSKEKLEDEISTLESKIYTINRVIEERWKYLIGFGCGYFDTWTLNDLDVVAVKYNSRSGEGTDYIPIRFFEGDDKEEAKSAYDKYIEGVRRDVRRKEEEKKEVKEKNMLKNLLKKYGEAP